MAKRLIKNTPADPTLAYKAITLDGVEYKLCFDYGSLAEAEHHFRKQGHDVNLLFSLPEMNLYSTRINFACALRKFHPEIGFEQAVSMVTLRNMQLIAAVIFSAWVEAMPEVVAELEKNV